MRLLYCLVCVWYANFIVVEDPIVVFIIIVVWNFRPLSEAKCHAVCCFTSARENFPHMETLPCQWSAKWSTSKTFEKAGWSSSHAGCDHTECHNRFVLHLCRSRNQSRIAECYFDTGPRCFPNKKKAIVNYSLPKLTIVSSTVDLFFPQ